MYQISTPVINDVLDQGSNSSSYEEEGGEGGGGGGGRGGGDVVVAAVVVVVRIFTPFTDVRVLSTYPSKVIIIIYCRFCRPRHDQIEPN